MLMYVHVQSTFGVLKAFANMWFYYFLVASHGWQSDSTYASTSGWRQRSVVVVVVVIVVAMSL